MIIGDDGLINVDVGGNNGGNGALIDINVDDGVMILIWVAMTTMMTPGY
jgi:hypothetical protein